METNETTPSANRRPLVQADARRANVALAWPLRVPDLRPAVSGVLGRAFTRRTPRAGFAARHECPTRPGAGNLTATDSWPLDCSSISRIGEVTFSLPSAATGSGTRVGGSDNELSGAGVSGFYCRSLDFPCLLGQRFFREYFHYGLSGDQGCGGRLALLARINRMRAHQNRLDTIQTTRHRIPARTRANRIGRSSCWSMKLLRCGFSFGAVMMKWRSEED